MQKYFKGKNTSSFTFASRHSAATHHITASFAGRENVVAWVIGLGVEQRKKALRNFEHIEVARSLKNAGIKNYRVIAMDNDVGAANVARQSLQTSRASQFEKKITVVGGRPVEPGDILRSTPAKRPDLISIFRVAQHYGKDAQEEMARILSDAILPGGKIYTNSNVAPHFNATLKKNLGAPKRVAPNIHVYTSPEPE